MVLFRWLVKWLFWFHFCDIKLALWKQFLEALHHQPRILLSPEVDVQRVQPVF